MIDQMKRLRWWTDMRSMLLDNGYRALPVRLDDDGELCPAVRYKDGETYPLGHWAWTRPVVVHHAIGFVLDRAVLLDYDANKVDANGQPVQIVGLPELTRLVGAPLGEPAQANHATGSLHWLFQLPHEVDAKTLKGSANGALTPHVDLMTGNIIYFLKYGKTLDRWGQIPRRIMLPILPRSLLALLEQNLEPRPTFRPYTASSGTSRGGASALVAECDAIANLTGAGRNDRLNRHVFKIYQLVAGGEILLADADHAVHNAIQSCDLWTTERSKTIGTIKSAKAGGLKNPRQLAPLRRGGSRA